MYVKNKSVFDNDMKKLSSDQKLSTESPLYKALDEQFDSSHHLIGVNELESGNSRFVVYSRLSNHPWLTRYLVDVDMERLDHDEYMLEFDERADVPVSLISVADALEIASTCSYVVRYDRVDATNDEMNNDADNDNTNVRWEISDSSGKRVVED